ncbi:hypothetical protein JZ751_024062 [Albula glossodonta]|uniref:Uncharacterized protein n=1 Tax=Albula glossodonta TaxID=121402 RepID=A0A8T2NF94_9TELE|nr:hypothetical protein JZ751_024062 [Albula glossodonta]
MTPLPVKSGNLGPCGIAFKLLDLASPGRASATMGVSRATMDEPMCAFPPTQPLKSKWQKPAGEGDRDWGKDGRVVQLSTDLTNREHVPLQLSDTSQVCTDLSVCTDPGSVCTDLSVPPNMGA